MRNIMFPIVNPVLERVPLSEYIDRVATDLVTGRLYLDGKPVERFTGITIEVADDATDEQIAQAMIDAYQNGGNDEH
jgi:hypothetical protein